MSDNPPPVPCPKCAERQNVSPGAFDPDDRAFHVHCMSCGHRFSPVEYKMSMAAVMNEPPKGLAAKAGGRPPAGGPGPGPGAGGRMNRSGVKPAHGAAKGVPGGPPSGEGMWASPNPDDPALTETVSGVDESGRPVETRVTVEKPLTLFLNRREIVTMMTICDYPEYLAVGYLANQNMLHPDDEITGIDYDEDVEAVIVRTAIETDYEDKLAKKTQTSGCAQGTVFGDIMETFDTVKLSADARVKTSDLFRLMKTVNTTPSLYLTAGAIHGCALCRGGDVLLYMEDVGRHNAVDKIAGYMRLNNVSGGDKLFYTTGRLTSEMVIKNVQMGIPALVSRSGFTAWGVDLARRANLTLIGRARGRRFTALAGQDRIVFDAEGGGEGEDTKHRRKGAQSDD